MHKDRDGKLRQWGKKEADPASLSWRIMAVIFIPVATACSAHSTGVNFTMGGITLIFLYLILVFSVFLFFFCFTTVLFFLFFHFVYFYFKVSYLPAFMTKIVDFLEAIGLVYSCLVSVQEAKLSCLG